MTTVGLEVKGADLCIGVILFDECCLIIDGLFALLRYTRCIEKCMCHILKNFDVAYVTEMLD